MDAIFAALHAPESADGLSRAYKDNLMQRLALLLPTDDYDPVKIESEEQDTIPVDSRHYSGIWPEAARLRAGGELLACAAKINCPVVAIHGDYDPHPAEGVRLPLTQRLSNFTFHLLPRCGHSPWRERYARELFYDTLIKEL